jgi:hypothetical protein
MRAFPPAFVQNNYQIIRLIRSNLTRRVELCSKMNKPKMLGAPDIPLLSAVEGSAFFLAEWVG